MILIRWLMRLCMRSEMSGFHYRRRMCSVVDLRLNSRHKVKWAIRHELTSTIDELTSTIEELTYFFRTCSLGT
jgi:hypothetical protein